MKKKDYGIVDSLETLEAALERIKAAQKEFAKFSQEQVDKIFLAAASAANKQRIALAKMAVEETGMGIVEDKVIKNHYASEYIYNAYKDTKTCGIVEEDSAYGMKKNCGTYRRNSCCHSHNKPDIDRDFQNSYFIKNKKRYHNKPSSQGQELHDRRSKDRT